MASTDFLELLPDVVGNAIVEIVGDPTIVGILALIVAGILIVFGNVGLQAGGAILFMFVYVLTAEGFLPIPVYILFLVGGAYALFAFIMSLYRR